MAGRDFGAYDSNPFRTEGGVNPFANFVGNGTLPSLQSGQNAKGGPAHSGAPNTALLVPLLQMLMSGKKIEPALLQQILAMLGQGK
jgi:hypothetical protein